ncbi:hypothetical protein [Roseiconus lacunae]|uniref:Uncharacterized protein n=1 Tax=Roseiconus lacunae TaxID=2605694 RepID=A0ABT7PH60_9BACT|nr:hypothetical protein [Roseiconus lacunae]MDM4015834.1 hypothetical protein [Roseiconus lacunae]
MIKNASRSKTRITSRTRKPKRPTSAKPVAPDLRGTYRGVLYLRNMERLTAAIPVIADASGLWLQDDGWIAFAARFRDGNAAERAAACFVISVWTAGVDHDDWSGLGTFDFVDASKHLDADCRAPIAAWFAKPWYP